METQNSVLKRVVTTDVCFMQARITEVREQNELPNTMQLRS